jgi:hypothetical protein
MQCRGAGDCCRRVGLGFSTRVCCENNLSAVRSRRLGAIVSYVGALHVTEALHVTQRSIGESYRDRACFSCGTLTLSHGATHLLPKSTRGAERSETQHAQVRVLPPPACQSVSNPSHMNGQAAAQRARRYNRAPAHDRSGCPSSLRVSVPVGEL